MAKLPKVYKVVMSKSGRGGDTRTYDQVGTLPELIKAYSYTLEVGASWAHEKGNFKINENPKSVKTLVKNLYNAKNNAAADGWSGCSFSEEPLTEADKVDYFGRQNLEVA